MYKLKSLVILIIIIIAAFLRLYNIMELPPGLYPDEAMNGNNALEAIATGDFNVFYPENNGREGLLINIQALSVLVFGNKPWALRLPSAIFGVLTVLGVYLLAKELFSYEITKIYENTKVKIALLSSFFLATSFWHINFSRIGFRAIMAPFFLTWGVYFLLKTLRNTNQCEFTNSYIRKNSYFVNSILGGVFFGLGFHTYIAYRATPLLISIILFLYWLDNKEWQIRKKILLSTFYFLLSAIIVALPIGIYFLQNPEDFFGRTAQISIFNSPTLFKDLGMNILKTAGMFNFAGDGNWRHNYAGKPQLFWPIGILFLIGIIALMRRLFSKKTEYFFTGIILFSWLIIAVLPTIISNEGLPHALRALLMIPPVFIFAGFGSVWLYEIILTKLRNGTKIRKSIIHASLFIILLLLIFEVYYSYFIKWGKNPNVQGAFAADYVQIGRELNALPQELPKYVIVEANGVDVRGIPMPAQTVMFITDTFTPKKQKEKNIFYVLPNQINQIPENSFVKILR